MKRFFDWISIDPKKGIAGGLLGIGAMLCCFAYGSGLNPALPCLLVYLALGLLKIRTDNRWISCVLNFLWGTGCLVLTVALSVIAIGWTGIFIMGIWHFALNVLILCVGVGLVYICSLNWKLSVTVITVLMAILAIINGFVLDFRGRELMFVDLRSLRTAISVAGQYKFQIPRLTAYMLLIWGAGLFAQFSFPSVIPDRKALSRMGAGVLSLLMAAVVWLGAKDTPCFTYYIDGTVENGFYLNYLLGIRDSIVREPEGYSLEAVQELEKRYPELPEAEAERLPNVIVIVSESFADMNVLGEPVRTDRPITPFLDSLQENTIRGYCLTSIFGGNTANAEFEVLTGHSMANLPAGSVAFQQYVFDNMYSLPWLLKEKGYTSISTHPYDASGWSRTKVYPAFGFDKSMFIDDYVEPEYLRHYVSDQALVDHLVEQMDNQGDAPLFLYAVSMQNHGGYDYTGLDYEETLQLESSFPEARQYLDLLSYTDRSMENLLGYLEQCERDTVVLFFGDHFPEIDWDYYRALHGGEFSTLQEQQLQYTVPFLIWANYDIPEETVDCTGMNYLSRYLLDAAGMELPPYYRFLKELEQVIPAMNAFGYYSTEQEGYVPYEEARGEEAVWLNRYAILQYNNIFDGENRSAAFFGQYLP